MFGKNIFGFNCAGCEYNRDCYGGNTGGNSRCTKFIKKMESLEQLEQDVKKLKQEINGYDLCQDCNLAEENEELKEKINKAIDKLICWGECLDADFQKEMLDILGYEEE